VRIGQGVTAIDDWVFSDCGGLTAIHVDARNPAFSSLDGVLFDKTQTVLLKYPEGRIGGYTVPPTVTALRDYSFQDTAGLTSVALPGSVTRLGSQAFANCPNLTTVSIEGEAPAADASVFAGDAKATVYYFPGAVNWEAAWAGRPTALWNPQMPTADPGFGVRQGVFGFTITGSSNLVLVVEACTNLAGGSWSPVGTNTLTEGVSHFGDREWTDSASRFYRLRSP
jgi:hypothetical protein